MAYDRTDWKNGDIITAPKLNNIENGLGKVASSIEGIELALQSKESLVCGYQSTAGAKSITIGPFAKSGSNAVSVGFGAGSGLPSDDCVSIGQNAYGGSQSIEIGHESLAFERSVAVGCNAQTIGQNSILLGAQENGDVLIESNAIKLGNTNTSTLTCSVELTVTSDERDKTDISVINKSLSFVNQLTPIQYVRNPRKRYIDYNNLSNKEKEDINKYGLCRYDKKSHSKGTKKGDRLRVGLSAQEIQAALEKVYGTADYANIVNDNLHDTTKQIPSDIENSLTVAYGNLIPFLIGAVNELSERLKKLEGDE